MSISETQDWLTPWSNVPQTRAAILQRELKSEVGPNHVLFGREVQAIAWRFDRDDVLFVVESPREFAVVHLTYASHPEPNPDYPETRLFPSSHAFNARCMVPDHREFGPDNQDAANTPCSAAHRHASWHREEALSSDICGCFYCLKVFKPSEITDWVDESNEKQTDIDDIGQTALCPHCGIDSVIGSSSGFPITVEFLKEMNVYWF